MLSAFSQRAARFLSVVRFPLGGLTYETLITADIYRDGGSMDARFECEGGRFESLWLGAKPEDRSYTRFVPGKLRISPGADGARTGREVAIGSPEETEVLTRLTAFMQSPRVNAPFGERTPIDYYLQKVAALITAIPNRKG